MIAIDLFCGKGGWTNGLMATGFTVYGFDLHPQPDYKGIFVQRDILEMTAEELASYKPDFATCSSPCEQFSVHCMKHFHPNPKHPELGIKLFEHSREMLEALEIPYVMENVRCAERFVGRAVNHCGPFYLWGNAVPAVMPREIYKIRKGMDTGGSVYLHMSREGVRNYMKEKRLTGSFNSKSKERKEITAQNAMIPLPISQAVAEAAVNLCTEVK